MKSAQQRFNEYLDESRETSDAVREFVDSAFENHGSFTYAAGYLEAVVKDLVPELPRAKRAEIREQFYRMAQKMKNEGLLKTVKESA